MKPASANNTAAASSKKQNNDDKDHLFWGGHIFPILCTIA